MCSGIKHCLTVIIRELLSRINLWRPEPRGVSKRMGYAIFKAGPSNVTDCDVRSTDYNGLVIIISIP